MNSRSDTDITAVELLDGRVVTLRRLGGQDTDAVLALHQHLPDQDLYLRFFTMRPAHLERLVHQLTQPNATCCAVGAFDADRLIGVANYMVSNDYPRTTEVAIQSRTTTTVPVWEPPCSNTSARSPSRAESADSPPTC
jgi:hypothetical protein